MALLGSLFLTPNSSSSSHYFPPTPANHNSIPRSPPHFLPLNPRRPTPPPPLRLTASSSSSSSSSSTPDAQKNPNSNKRRPKPRNDHPPDPAAAADPRFPSTIPRKPRRGRPGEAAAVEDFVRASLERTFASIRAQNSEILAGKQPVLKSPAPDEEEDKSSPPSPSASSSSSEEDGGEGRVVVEEEDPDWPVDAEVGWGVRASDYFDNHPIKNVVVDGKEIDWEGEVDEGWVKEITCLEWESFAFHPSPLVVLVFERYNRASDNWKLLKELEKAAKVYWSAKDRLPPRTVKIDINIETDLAYALKVKECPQLLFLRGNRILYREKEIRTADELVQMIAHFYYNAKRPSWLDDSIVASPF